MTPAEIQELLYTNEGFVNAKRFDNSIERLEERYPDGAPDHVVAAALLLTEEEVDVEYGRIVIKLRDLMGVEA